MAAGAGGDGSTTSKEMICCVGGEAVAGGEAIPPRPHPPDGDVVHTTLFVNLALHVAAFITLTVQDAWLSPPLRKNTRTALFAKLFSGVTLMKTSWTNGSTLNGPFVLVNSSWGDARRGLDGEVHWLSFCAASFADSAQNLSPRGSMPLTHEKPSGPKRRRAERRHAMPTLLHR